MTMEMSEGFYKALHYAKAAGSQVTFEGRRPPIAYESVAYRSYIPKPGRILWLDERRNEAAGATLIHEIHHDLIWRKDNFLNPMRHREDGFMMALDHWAMRLCNLPWAGWMQTFWIGEGTWWENKPTTRKKWLQESYDEAIDFGWLDKNKKPLFLTEELRCC